MLPNIAESLGATFSDEERDGYMAVRRYASYLIGIPETILFHDESEALRLFDIGVMCEPPPGEEAIVMANSMINTGPLLLDVSEPAERRCYAGFIYRFSRALIGKPLPTS